MEEDEDQSLPKGSFGVIPRQILENEEISEGAKLFYLRLTMYFDHYGVDHYGECMTSLEHFSKICKTTEEKNKSYLLELNNIGYLSFCMVNGFYLIKMLRII